MFYLWNGVISGKWIWVNGIFPFRAKDMTELPTARTDCKTDLCVKSSCFSSQTLQIKSAMSKVVTRSILLAHFAVLAHGAALRDAALPGGVVVHVGCGDVEAVASLGTDKRFVVQALDVDAGRVGKLRAELQAKGLNGRVSARVFDGKKLPYIDNLINAIVIPNAGHGIPPEEIDRVLAPLGIRLIAGRKTVKQWPAELDSWPHWLYGPENNAVSKDTRVGISRSMQWIMPPAWGRHHNMIHSVNAMVCDKGRLYYIMDLAPIAINGPTYKWTLGCRDAFNGMDLWQRPIEDWGWHKWSAVETGGTMRFRGPDQLYRRLVAADGRIYVTLGFHAPVSELDGKTGKTLRTYKGTENTATIQFKDGVLYLARNVLKGTPGKTIMAVDAATGKTLWERTGLQGITPQGTEMKKFTDAHLTVGKDRVFFIDGDDIGAFDIKTGKDAWRRPRPEMKKGVFGHYSFNYMNFCTLVYHDGMVYLGQVRPNPNNLNRWQQKETVVWGLDAATGKKVWEYTGMTLSHFTPPDLFINNGLVWTMKEGMVELIGLDARTGEEKKKFPVKEMLVGHHHRCYRNKASKNFYLAGEEGIEYIDFASGALDVHHWLRGACAYGIMPANGLIYLPAHACGCHGNAKLNGFIALNSSNIKVNGRMSTDGRLEKGPAFVFHWRGVMPVTQEDDWTTYKHDGRRSNATVSAVPTKLQRHWSVAVGGTPTAPVVVGNKVYVAVPDRHEVVCAFAENGKNRWRFTADGRVDTPPTWFEGCLYFGTRAGSVYKLRHTGAMAWRFRAAPGGRQLAAHGQLESVWPVHGTVYVADGKLYFAAGRSTNLDSGLFLYVLDPETGKVLRSKQLEADIESKGECAGAVVSGILVGDGDSIYLRNVHIDREQLATGGQPSGSFLIPNSGGLLDSSWYNSSFWKYKGALAQMLVFDDRAVCGISAYKKQAGKSYPHDVLKMGTGYSVFAAGLGPGTPAPSTKGRKGKKGRRRERGRSNVKKMWEFRLPVRAEAMVLTPDALCLAGIPDVVDKDDPWGAFENRKGGVLMILNRKDGKVLQELKLDSAPVYDGMAVANGKLFLSLKNGRLACFGE